MDTQKDTDRQKTSTDEIRRRWESGQSIGLAEVSRAYGVPLSESWGILQQLDKPQQRSVK